MIVLMNPILVTYVNKLFVAVMLKNAWLDSLIHVIDNFKTTKYLVSTTYQNLYNTTIFDLRVYRVMEKNMIHFHS